MIRSIFIALTLYATSSFGDTCPKVQDISDDMSALIAKANAAQTQSAGDAVNAQMWALWTQAPDDYAQNLLDSGINRREVYDFDGALAAFNALIDYCPDYAEGYNQRAFVNFLRHDFASALPDLVKTLEMSPDHVAAQSGKALTLIGLGRSQEAYIALKLAVKKNPWISERGLLPSLAGDAL